MTDLFLRDFQDDLDGLKRIFYLNIIVFNLGFYFSIILALLEGFYDVFQVIIIAFLIAVLSFFLFLFRANKFKNKIGDHRSKEIFKIIQKLYLMSFISILMNVILIFYDLIKVIVCIIIVIKYYNNFKKLKDIYSAENLSESIRIPSMIVLFGMIISGISFGNVIGTIIISFGMILIHRETFQFTNQGDFLKLSYSLTHPKSIQQSPETIFEKTEITGKEDISQPILETTVVKAEIKPEFVKKPEITIKEEISQPIPETMDVKIEIKQELVKKPELMPEIAISPKKEEMKKPGFLNFKINRRKVSDKQIRNEIIKKETKPLVLKKCPFCGKKREDLNITFCYACGYKF